MSPLNSHQNDVGRSMFIVLDNFGFRLMWSGIRLSSWTQIDSLGFDGNTELEIVISSNDTSVSRQICLADLWEDVPVILAAALSAWSFLVEPSCTT